MKVFQIGKERRRFPRRPLELPLEYHGIHAPFPHGGIVLNASEGGLLMQSVKTIPVGTHLEIAILFPKVFELSSFEISAEVIWKELYWREDWEGFHFGMKVTRILEGDRIKLNHVLSRQFHSEESAHPS